MTSRRGGGGCRLTLDDLDDSLLAGSPSLAAHIRRCPECRARLDALRRLGVLGDQLVREEARAAGAGDRSWLEDVLARLSPGSRAGRSVPRAPVRVEVSFLDVPPGRVDS